jgi:hypothetical protein
MKLTKSQAKRLQNMDLVEATRKARKKSYQLLNDQGFATLALAISHIIAQVAESPEQIEKDLKL